jgi:ribonucleotide reductase beta subunit family protein with ferritin-like domain
MRGVNRLQVVDRYHGLWEMYKKAVASFWTVEEVDLSQDMRDWDKLTGEQAASFAQRSYKRSFPP